MSDTTSTHLGHSATPLPGAGAFVPGTVLAERYRIVARVGRGGMGEVYRADDLKLGQPVALKFLPPDLERDPVARERLLAEVRLARTISHPNVCRVYDVGEVAASGSAPARSFLTMEFIDGEDLSSLLRRIGRLPGAKALEIARQLCAGLSAAHDKGVLHRDLKPANVMIDGRGQARIADFGIAVAAQPGEGAREDHAGTVAYMAPERFAGKPATIQSDLYALGLILYETYTGKSAFTASTLGDWQRAHTSSAPSSPSAIVADIDPAVERVILRCLDKEPARRPASAALVAVALPGGDPLAAAIAAGETPSPELVAASGEEGTLPRGRALLLLGSVVVALALFVPLFASVLRINHVPMPLDPSALERKGREILASLGHTNPPVDWVSSWGWSGSAERMGQLRMVYTYRQSPTQIFVPIGLSDVGTQSNYQEDAILEMDSEGRLRGLDIGGGEVYSDTGAATDVNWAPLLEAIAPETTPVPSSSRRWPPAFYADTRAVWTAVVDGEPSDIEAAGLRGRPVGLRVRAADAPDEDSTPARNSRAWLTAVLMAMSLGVPAVLALFARRNIRLGRGDRRGAFRLSVFAMCSMASYIGLARHWNPGQPGLLLIGLRHAIYEPLFSAVMIWVAYMGVEPYVRRRWPSLLISWTRLLDGRAHDGLVGQALLIGTLGGILLAGLQAAMAKVHISLVSGELATFYAVGWVNLASGLGTAAAGCFQGMVAVGILVLGRVVLRRDWAAWFLLLIVGSMVFAMTRGNVPLGLLVGESVLLSGFCVAVLYRFGLLTFVATFFVSGVLTAAPLTLDTSRWYFWRGLVPLVIVLAFAIWGFKNVLGKQSLFPEGALED